MSLPDQYLLSDLLKHRVRCNQGIDHGIGVSIWMHPPVHRILGWVSRPSNIKLARDIWRLDQTRAISDQHVYVKGKPYISEQATVDRLPSLIEADLLNINGKRLGLIVDLVFQFESGKIINYIVSRSDPRLPGTSRWKLAIDHIVDQQPGFIFTNLLTLDDIPLIKSSVKQDFLKRSRIFRDQIQEFGVFASDKLEGWLEEPPWEDTFTRDTQKTDFLDDDPLEGWDDLSEFDGSDYPASSKTDNRDLRKNYGFDNSDNEEDPWI